MKTWYCVTSSVDNKGRMTAAITESVQAATMAGLFRIQGVSCSVQR